MRITKLQLLKMLKKANRDLAKRGPRGGFHRKSRKDKADKEKNTVKKEDYGLQD